MGAGSKWVWEASGCGRLKGVEGYGCERLVGVEG